MKCNDKIQLWLQSEKITKELYESGNMIFNPLRVKNERIRETDITAKNLYITLYNVGLLLHGRT